MVIKLTGPIVLGPTAHYLTNTVGYAIDAVIVGLITHWTGTPEALKSKSDICAFAGHWVSALCSQRMTYSDIGVFLVAFNLANEILRFRYWRRTGHHLSPLGRSLWNGLVAGSLAYAVTSPLKIIALSAQRPYKEAAVYEQDRYAGLLTTMVDSTIEYTIYAWFARLVTFYFSGDRQNLTTLQVFMIGVVAKLVALLVTDHIDGLKSASTTGRFVVHQQTGINGFFTGLGFKRSRKVIRAGIYRLVAARLREFVFAFMIWASRVRIKATDNFFPCYTKGGCSSSFN